MCGISGFYSYSEVEIEGAQLKSMTDMIAHRGPDAEGYWIVENNKTALGHRRLSIIDSEERSNQPFQYKNLHLSFNGEIYNYLEIKNELLQLGYEFQTKGDTEVLIMALHEWGISALNRLDGMFAFALYNSLEDSLILARDRFGEKPLYYSYDEKRLIFASEIKSLARFNGNLEVNEKAVYRYLTYDVVENPNDKSETFYKDVHAVPPSHYVLINRSSEKQITRYFSISNDVSFHGNEREAIEKFQSLFDDSVEKRLRSDVPIGTSLSGGLDSSAVASTICSMNDNKLNTFTARFENKAFDEGKFIDILEQSYGFNRHDVWPNEVEFNECLNQVFYHQEEPFGSSSIFAQWEVMKSAKENNVTVLLDGQGADEILAGYFKYLPLGLKQSLFRNPLKALKELKSVKKNLGVRFGIGNIIEIIWPGLFNQIRRKPLFSTKKKQIESGLHPTFLKKIGKIENPFLSFHNLNEMLHFDTFNYGLGKLLRFSDRNSMAFSREVRLPFLQHNLVEFIFSLPNSMKINIPWTKFILRKAMEGRLPEEIIWRKDKKGFSPPQEDWLASKPFQELISKATADLINRQIVMKKEGFNPWHCIMIYHLYQFAERDWSSDIQN